MANYIGRSQTATFAAEAIANITRVSYTDSADVPLAAIAGASYKTGKPAFREVTVTVEVLADLTGQTEINAIAPGTAGTWTHYPNGNTAGYLMISSTNATVKDRPHVVPVDDYATMTFTMHLDDITYGTATGS